jgi:hypothetical protein
MRIGDDLPTQGFSGLGQTALVNQEGGLFLRLGHDPLGLVLGLLDDPLTFGVDPLGGADLLRHRDAQLIDQPECRVLVEHDVARQRQLLAIGDQRFEALDEEDDVDRGCPPGDGRLGSGRTGSIMARGPGFSRP